MDVNEVIRRTIGGAQNSSLEYMKRFSLCDCITIPIPDTYTAMGAGLELFLEKFVPGERFIMPYAQVLPEDKLKKMRPIAYKTPKKIDTFLWSPFHEATSQYYSMGDEIKYAFRLKGGFLVNWKAARRVQPPTKTELLEQVRRMDKKVSRIWPDAKKIMIMYERSRMIDKSQGKRLNEFTKESLNILNWPVVKMELTEYDSLRPRKKIGIDENGIVWNGWEHYSKEAYKRLTNKIIKEETR